MASSDIRKLLESFRQIDEGYMDRVKAFADKINKMYADDGGITKKELIARVVNSNEVEARGSDKARNDFIKDVAALVKMRRDNSAAVARGAANKAAAEAAMQKLDYIVQDAVGNAFPDGDPWDAIAPKARRLGIPEGDLLKWLDRWARKNAGIKGGWHAYLAQAWDDFNNDTGLSPRNPWR